MPLGSIAARRRSSFLRSLAWLPIPALALGVTVLWVANPSISHESPYLLVSLNLLFSTVVSVIIAYFVGESFLRQGAPGLLLLFCGVVVWGCTGTVGVMASISRMGRGPLDPNIFITVHNSGVWVSAMFHLGGVIVSLQLSRTLRANRIWLVLGLVVATALSAAITLLALHSVLPAFFIQGSGGTGVRRIVMGSAIATFTLTCVLLRTTSSSRFTHWYSLGLLLLAVGLLGVTLQSSTGSPLNWISRIAQYLGGVYMLVAALAASGREAGVKGITLAQALNEARHRYLVAITVVLAAITVRAGFFQFWGTKYAFVTLYPAVTVAALYGGFGPGLLASVLSVLIANCLWTDSVGTLAVTHPEDWLAVGMFFASGCLVSVVAEAMHRAEAKAREALAEAAAAAERERSTQAVRSSEERYRSLFNGMTEGFAIHEIICDAEGKPCDWRFLDINPAFERLTGLKREEVVGHTHNEVLPNDDPKWVEIYGRVALTGEPVQFDNYSPALQRHYEVFAYRPADRQFAVIFMDVTPTKQVEHELRQRGRELQTLADNVPDIIGRLDRGLRHVFVSGAIRQVTGKSVDEYLGKTNEELGYPPDMCAYWSAQFNEVFRTGLPRQFEFSFTTPREPVYLSLRAVPEFGQDGQVESLVFVTRDITSIKQAQAALAESEQMLARAEKIANIGSWEWDIRSGKLTWSDHAYHMFGVDRTRFVPTYELFLNCIHPEDRLFVAAAVRDALAGRRPYDVQYRITSRAPVERWVHSHGEVTRDEAGQPVRMTGTVLDITQMRLVEEERARLMDAERSARTEAERALRLQREFLSMVSHELRNPLNALLGWTKLLAKGSVELPKAVDIISRSASSLAQIVADLIDTSQIVSGKTRLNPEPTDLVGLVGNVLEGARPAAEAKGITIDAKLDADLRPVVCDPNRVQQVVQNLLSNAVKFTPEGGAVKVTVGRQPDFVSITVTDNGQGIRPDFLPFVFDRFRQADQSIGRRHGGLGLGLSIVKHLVELHGGTVRVESAGEGKGATFVVLLPWGSATNPEQPFSFLSRRPASDGVQEDLTILRGRKVLAVDDDPGNCEMVARILDESGALTRTATSGEEGLRLLVEFDPDLVISDIGMPQMHGYEFIRRVRAMGGKYLCIPCLALTAFARPEDREDCLRAGYDEHLPKPFNVVHLAQALARLTQQGGLGHVDDEQADASGPVVTKPENVLLTEVNTAVPVRTFPPPPPIPG